MEKKRLILKLNKNFYPVQECHWKDAFINIASGAAFPVDINYAIDEKGNVDLKTIEYFNVVRTFEEWAALPVRPYDEYVTTPNRVFRLPPIVVCSKFDKIIYKEVVFPTKHNILKRDQWTCIYSGEKLTRETASVDHIIAKSKGGQNTWENLAACHKLINNKKGDKTLKEANLKLLWKPFKPVGGMTFNFIRDEWKLFIDGGDFE